MQFKESTARHLYCDEKRYHPYPTTDVLFGYLGRVCPSLQVLSLVISNHVWALRSGLCLLTRLWDLQLLELRLEPAPCLKLEQYKRSDFAWIRAGVRSRASSSPPLGATEMNFRSGSKSWNRSLRPSALLNHNATTEKDFAECLEKARKRSIEGDDRRFDPIAGNKEGIRERLLKQQLDNGYRTSYDRDLPMVDGLKGHQFSGSYLDIEAFLHAQQYILRSSPQVLQQQQQQQQQMTQSIAPKGDADSTVVETTRSMPEPWSNMEQFIIVYETYASQRRKRRQSTLNEDVRY